MKKILKIDNLELEYYKEGTGSPMILVHGWASNISEWDIIKDELRKRFTIYYFNLPGHGLSTEWEKEYSIENYAVFLYDFITKLELDNIILLGQSMGSSIIIDFVLKYGDKVKIKKVVLSSLVISEPRLLSKSLTLILHKYYPVYNFAGNLRNNKLYQNLFMKFICLKDSVYYNQIIFSSKEGLNQISKKAYAGCLISILNFNSKNILKEVMNEDDFLLVYGNKDKLSHYKKINDLNYNNMYILENSAHSPTREQKIEFFKILDSLI